MNRATPYFDDPNRRARWLTTISPTRKPSGVRQDGHEPVQLAVDADLVEHLAAIDLEAAVVVVQLAAGQLLTIQLKTRLGPTLCQGSCRVRFQPLTTSSPWSSRSRKRGISAGSSWRSPSRVKTISPRRGLEPGRQRRGLAEVAAEADRPDPRVALGQAPGRPPTSRRGCRRRRRGTRPARVAVGEDPVELGVERRPGSRPRCGAG